MERRPHVRTPCARSRSNALPSPQARSCLAAANDSALVNATRQGSSAQWHLASPLSALAIVRVWPSSFSVALVCKTVTLPDRLQPLSHRVRATGSRQRPFPPASCAPPRLRC